MALQPIDSAHGEVRREGATAIQHSVMDNRSKTSGGMDRMFGVELNGTAGDGAPNSSKIGGGGYVGMPGELERNDDTRHPTSKIWVRRDRKPNAYLHTGNG